MKSTTKKSILIVFLLMLFIGPMILAPSFISPSRQNEPNTVKDFAPATEYSPNEQSINSFAETLPDNVLYFPDGDLVSDTFVASSGSSTGEHPVGSYVSTQAIGGDIYSNDDYSDPHVTAIYLNFTVPYASSVTVSFYATYLYQDTTADVNEIGVWNGTSWIDFGNISNDQYAPYDETWVNFTISSNYVIDETISVRGYLENDDNIFIKVDYAEIYVTYPIMLSSNSYAESFANVSDWAYHSDLGLDPTEYSISTDGDIATIEILPNDAGNEWVIYNIVPSGSISVNSYFEARIKTVGASWAYAYVTGTTGQVWPIDGLVRSEWFTVKAYLPSLGAITGNITGIFLYCNDYPDATATGTLQTQWDYLRISPANETGWQHDGSTTEGVVDGIGDFTYSSYSDGETLNLTVTKTSMTPAWGNISIVYDTTTTAADLELDYYQFCEIRYRVPFMDNQEMRGFPIIDGVMTDENGEMIYHFPAKGPAWRTLRMNLAAMTISTDRTAGFVFACYQQFTNMKTIIEIDYIKYYSIANFTVTQSGTSTDDILYVSSNVLYCEGTSFTSIVLDHDPALSFETNRSLWTMTTSSGTPQIDFYITDWLGYTSDTSGSFPSGTLTDLRLNFTDNANIEAVTFLSPIPQWNEVGIAIFYFSVPYDMWGYNTGLIILGLVMIPVSTIYLAYGIKHDRSSERLFYGLIIFFLGFGLLIGGIMP